LFILRIPYARANWIDDLDNWCPFEIAARFSCCSARRGSGLRLVPSPDTS
jgi:hypothetical protein